MVISGQHWGCHCFVFLIRERVSRKLEYNLRLYCQQIIAVCCVSTCVALAHNHCGYGHTSCPNTAISFCWNHSHNQDGMVFRQWSFGGWLVTKNRKRCQFPSVEITVTARMEWSSKTVVFRWVVICQRKIKRCRFPSVEITITAKNGMVFKDNDLSVDV